MTTETETPKLDPLAGLKIESLPQDEWLRMHYDPELMSASRVAAALGYSDFSSPLQCYAELKNLIPGPDQTLAMELGHDLEPIVAKYYARYSGRETWDPGEYSIIRHPHLPWLFCTLDRVTVNEAGQPGPLELKATGSFARGDWKEGAPVMYAIQHQIQMLCTGMEWGSLAALVGNQELFWHDIERNDNLGAQLLKATDAFHNRVLAGDPPEATYQDAGVIKALHPLDDGSTLALTADKYADDLIRHFEALKDQLKETEKDFGTTKAKLQALIGDHTFIDTGGAKYSFKHQSRTSKATLDEESQELCKAEGIVYNEPKTSHFRVLRKMALKK